MKLTPGTGNSSRPVLVAGTVTTRSDNDRIDGRADGIFEYTVITGDVVYSYVLKRAVERFVTDDGNEESRFPIRKWMKSLPPSYIRQLGKMLRSCRGRRFLVLDTGYIRLTPLEAKNGDLPFIISRISVPFVLT